ncbi:MAG: hypothetical protein Q9214_001660 [Letrouitia sp. 1 TL-2023]
MADVQSPKPVGHPSTPASPRTAPRTAPRTGLEKLSGNQRIEAKGMGPNQSSIASRPPKLRESCNACAAVKIRCTKKRPTCTRCDERGLSCEYVATKRRGRPSQAPTQSVNKIKTYSGDARRYGTSKKIKVPSPPFLCKTTPSVTTFSASPALVISSPTQHDVNTTTDAPPDALAFADCTVAPSSAVAFGAELDDFFSSLGFCPWLETSTHDILPTPSCVDALSNTRDSNSGAVFTSKNTFPTAEEAYSDIQTQPNPNARPDSRYSTTDSLESASILCGDSYCCCLKTSLGFLKDLSANSSKAYAFQGDAGPSFPIQSVIAKNERIVEAIDSMLQCFCSQDGYLLTVLSLVAFRVLDWYAAAGRAAPTFMRTADSYKSNIRKPSNALKWSASSSASQFAGSFGMDNEDPGRLAAQTILGELHRAQRLVNKLSARVRGMKIGGPISASDPIDILRDNQGAWPFFPTILDQLQMDLRKHLRTVSLKIGGMAQRG